VNRIKNLCVPIRSKASFGRADLLLASQVSLVDGVCMNCNYTFQFRIHTIILPIQFPEKKKYIYIYIYHNISISIKMDVCVCVFEHNSGTPGAISTKLGTYMPVCMRKNLMYVLYIFHREDDVGAGNLDDSHY
jgi:hypothetical protein